MKTLQNFTSLLTAFVFLATTFAPGLTAPALAVTADITQIGFTSDPGTLETAESGNFVIQLQNIGGTSEPTDTVGGETVTLSTDSTTGTFYGGTISGTCNTTVLAGDQVTFANGSSNKGFCYSDTTAGNHTITATLDSDSSVTGSTSLIVESPVVPVGDIRNNDTSELFLTIQDAIDDTDTDDGDVIEILSPTHIEGPQITIDKSITLIGSGMDNTTLLADGDTTTSGDSRGWILVPNGESFSANNLTFDGNGNKIWQAIRHTGTSGIFDSVRFTDIRYFNNGNDGEPYNGNAIAAFGTGPVDVTNSEFEDIGRIGVLYFGAGVAGSTFDGNTYTGKGDGDFLDYALDISNGAEITVTNNTVTNNTGVASSDSSTSAAILVSTFFGPGTEVVIEGNDLENNTTGIAVGFDTADTSSVIAEQNNIVGNDNGMTNTSENTNIDARENWWGDASGPSGEGPGIGDSADEGVLFSPWLCEEAPSNNTSVNGSCDEQTSETIVVTPGDLVIALHAFATDEWYFWDDVANTPSDTEVPGQFEFVTGPSTPPAGDGSVELSVIGSQRYNMATNQFAGVELSSIGENSFSTYQPSTNPGNTERAIYLNFDVDFDNTSTDGYQGRLVYVPRDNESVNQDTWQTFNASNGNWRWSGYDANGGQWPDGDTDELRSWSEIISEFPNAEVFNESFTGNWLFRAGEPYADGFTGNVDNFVLQVGTKTISFDFEPEESTDPHPDDRDNDGVDNHDDNCPYTTNPDQTDSDGDGVGNACDSTPHGEEPPQNQCYSHVYPEFHKKNDQGAVQVTSFNINNQSYSEGDSFPLFVSGDTPAQGSYTDEVRVSRTPDGLELYFYGNTAGTLKKFHGSFELEDADTTTAVVTAGSEPLETTGQYVDEVYLDKNVNKIFFTLYVTTGNDSFILSGLESACEDDGGENPNQCVPGEDYADEVISSNQGAKKDGSEITDVARTDAEDVLGAPDGQFFSLGKKGDTTVKFDTYIVDQPGMDISIHETTGGNRNTYPEETASIKVSQDGSSWEAIGSASSKNVNGLTLLDISGTSFSYVQYVRVTDTTDFTPHNNNADGFDLDAVDAVYAVCEEPEDNDGGSGGSDDRPSLVITNPDTDGKVLGKTIYTFTAEYNDDDEVEDDVDWAIYAGTSCSFDGSNRIAGNADGDVGNYNPSTGEFSAEVDLSDEVSGDYCFVVNPDEQDDGTDLRETRTFILSSEDESETIRTGGGPGLAGSSSSSNNNNNDEEEGETLGVTTTGAEQEEGSVAGATTCNYAFLTQYMNTTNNPARAEVLKLQLFMNLLEGMNLAYTGDYDLQTFSGVKSYQTKYASDILSPWGLSIPTGYVYITTRKHINERFCNEYSEQIPPLVPDENIKNTVVN